MKKGLMRSVKDKLFPSEYHKMIDQGKDLMFKADFKGALDRFQRAMDMNDTPTLACFYAGQAEYMQKAMEAAEDKYQDGLDYNNIHYKCLTGLFDLLHGEKRYNDAYDVMRRLAQYFPANPKRLASVLHLSIQTGHYDDVESYYGIFKELEERTDEMIRYMCSTLAVTGKHYLMNHSNEKAIQSFENAAISSAGRIKYLYYMIEALVEYGLIDNTDKFISRLKTSDPGSKELIAAQFLTIDKSASPVDVVNKGRSVIRDGVEFPSVYQKLISNSLMAGYKDSALELAAHAIKKWPDKSNLFTVGFSEEELKSIGIL
jgi:tetratricopeptide (TPR) repeat protein